jgi:hypothetical protein
VEKSFIGLAHLGFRGGLGLGVRGHTGIMIQVGRCSSSVICLSWRRQNNRWHRNPGNHIWLMGEKASQKPSH